MSAPLRPAASVATGEVPYPVLGPTQALRRQVRRGTESDLGRTRRARRMYRALQDCYLEVRAELDFTNPLELAVATILSAQCTDVRVNQVTPALFSRYPTAVAYAEAQREELEELIRPTGFFRNKATSLMGLGRQLVERFDGQVPSTLDELVSLPGIGRKTANVVLGNAFATPGITVDTHFGRLVRRWGWTQETDPVRVEHAIGALFPAADWTGLSHRVIYHGRRVCHARKPACGACPLSRWCPAYGEGPTEPALAAALVKGPEREHLLNLVGLGVGPGGVPPGEEPGARYAAGTVRGGTAPTEGRP